jgi:uncharacterized protein (DUF4415 family)
MAKPDPTIALEADPSDPDDFDVSEDALEQALADRRERRKLRGPQKAPTKTPVSIRIDTDLVERLRATGPGWQGRVNEALRKAFG